MMTVLGNWSFVISFYRLCPHPVIRRFLSNKSPVNPSRPSMACRWRSPLHPHGFIERFELHSETEQHMCQNRPMRGTSKNARITRVLDVAAWFRSDCDEECMTANRQISKCRR